MLLDKNEIDEFIKNNAEWKLDGKVLLRELEFKNFSEALAFVAKLGVLAEKSGHHPDIKIYSWNKVSVTLSTHSEGGITEKDISLAEELEKLL